MKIWNLSVPLDHKIVKEIGNFTIVTWEFEVTLVIKNFFTNFTTCHLKTIIFIKK